MMKKPVKTGVPLRLWFSHLGETPVLNYALPGDTVPHPAQYFRCNNRVLKLDCLTQVKLAGRDMDIVVSGYLFITDELAMRIAGIKEWRVSIDEEQFSLLSPGGDDIRLSTHKPDVQ